MAWVGLVPILEDLLPVKFSFGREQRGEWAGKIVSGELTSRDKTGDTVVSSLRVPQCERPATDGALMDIQISFADDRDVPFPFRGRLLSTKVGSVAEQLKMRGNEKILASGERGPVWVFSEQGGVRHFRSAFALPVVPAQGNLRDVLNGERFLEMLPLLHWVRELAASSLYEGPPLRACFMFDDPNLHGLRYGFVDFQEIAKRAAKENYHVSFATIPLDTWYTHSATAEVFRTNASRLSLLVHGNDHTKQELARDYTPAERISLLTQAVRRIERLERSAGLRVSRVMVAPHGACSEEMLAELPRCGFEAACISHGSLRAHNGTRAWTKTLGYRPAELIRGCPVLPRWGLSARNTSTILLAAFLQQPIVLRGHQRDLERDPEILDESARFINSLGPVLWANMTDLSRMNYQWRMEGNTYRLKPWSLTVNLQVPSQANRLVIENPTTSGWNNCQCLGRNGSQLSAAPGESVLLPDSFGNLILLQAGIAPHVNTANGAIRFAPAALFRRLLTEGRDRFARKPKFYRLMSQFRTQIGRGRGGQERGAAAGEPSGLH